MTEVLIKNQKFLSKLDAIKDKYFSIPTVRDSVYDMFDPPDAKERGEHYVSDDFLKIVQARSHSGFPEEHFSHPTGRNAVSNPQLWKEFYLSVKYDFAMGIGATSNALFNYYPPGGFVGWHTNWNAPAYQILFTWSDTGEGYFKYQDPSTKEIVRIKDVPGWQCRHYYFAGEKEPEYHCWHAAYANCDRITLAFKFVNEGLYSSKDVMARQLRDELIEEIQSEE
jgi:hypothetical protein